MKNEFFKISEAAKLTGITRQGLIFYDQHDIIKPAYVAENGYRYYTLDQIHQIQMVKLFNEFDIPLKRIREYMKERSTEGLEALLTEIEKKMVANIKQTEDYLQMIRYKRIHLSEKSHIQDTDTIKLEYRDAFTVLCSEALDDDANQNHYAVSHAFETQLKQHNIVGLPLGTIINRALLTADYANEITAFCVRSPIEVAAMRRYTVASGLYAIGYHKGEVQNAYQSYRKLIAYIEANDFEVIGDAYDRKLSDFLTENEAEGYLLEIAIPINKKTH